MTLSKKDPIKTLTSRWHNMVQRCYNPNNRKFDRYGGRGILMCREWRENRKEFVKWALENGFDHNLEIDRIDNNRGYSPENCRWVTHQANVCNRENTPLLKAASRANWAVARSKIDRAKQIASAKRTFSRKTIIVETGEVFSSLTEACKALGAHCSNAVVAIQKNYKVKGVHLRYV